MSTYARLRLSARMRSGSGCRSADLGMDRG